MIQVRNALELYKQKAISSGLIKLKENESLLDHMDYLNMHLPYANMGKKALAYLIRHEWRTLPKWKKIIEKIGMDEPVSNNSGGTIEAVLQDTEFMEKDHEFTKRFSKTDEFQDVYESKLASSLIASKMIGNLYTASLYLGFRSSLEFEFQKGVDLDGKRIGFGSYGSGSSAMIFSGVIQPKYREVVKDMNLEAEISPRKRLSFEDYEALHENKLSPKQAILDSKKEFILVDVKTAPDSRGERKYVFNE